MLYEDVIWKGLKIILGRERAGIINYWYLDDRGEREGIKDGGDLDGISLGCG